MAPLSAIVTGPSVITGAFPKGCTSLNSFGAILTLDKRLYFLIVYGSSSSSYAFHINNQNSRQLKEGRHTKSQSIRCERESSRW